MTRLPDCYGYIRVSTGDQADNGVSLEAQQDIIVKEYQRIHAATPFNTFTVYCDSGVSAFSKNLNKRPEGARLLGACKPNDCVIITRLDRAFRNAADGHTTLAWFQKQRVRVVILDMPGGGHVDTSTPSGFMLISGNLQFAQFSSMMTSERIKSSFKYNMKVRGWGGQPLPGHSVRRINGKAVQYLEPSHVEEAKKFLGSFWKGGIDAVRDMINRNEIKFEKQISGKKHRINPFEDFTNKVLKAMHKSILALYCTNQIRDFAKECGVDIDQWFQPTKKLIRSPHTGGWIKTPIPKGCEDYDLVPRAKA